jgi:hypothetical protein
LKRGGPVLGEGVVLCMALYAGCAERAVCVEGFWLIFRNVSSVVFDEKKTGVQLRRNSS